MSTTLRQRLSEQIKKIANQRKKQLQTHDINSIKQINNNIIINTHNHQTIQSNHIINLDTPEPKQTIDVYSFRQMQLMKNPFLIQPAHPQQSQQEIEKQIQQMLKQKQQKNIINDDDYKKQLIFNTLKNKKKSRAPKPMDLPTPFTQLSPPYQQIKIFASYLPIYQQRRRRQLFTSLIDLGVKNLQQLIYQCFIQNIISLQFLKSIKSHNIQHQLSFIHKFSQNKLNQYNFLSTKFTPLDYRRLGILLMKKSKKYIWGQRIYCIFKQINDFYQTIFTLSEIQYQRLCHHITIKYQLTWWRVIDEQQQVGGIKYDTDLDTSTVFQLRPSPMFGADLNDDKKQFFLSKQQKYPEYYRKYNLPKKDKLHTKTSPQSKQLSQNSSQYSSSSSNQSISSSSQNNLYLQQQNYQQHHLLKQPKQQNSKSPKYYQLPKQSSNNSLSDIKLDNNLSLLSNSSQQSSSSNHIQQLHHQNNTSSDDSLYQSKSKSISQKFNRNNFNGKSKIISTNNKMENQLYHQDHSDSHISDSFTDRNNIFQDFDDD